MTATQKFVAEKLLQGCYLVPSPSNWYRLRTPEHIVVKKISEKTFATFKPLLRKRKNFFLLNKNIVRQLHGNHYIKQLYKSKEYNNHSITSKMSTHVSTKPITTNNRPAPKPGTGHTPTHLQDLRLF